MTCGFLIQLVFCKKKIMWFIGVEVERETSATPPKKNPGSAPVNCMEYNQLDKLDQQSATRPFLVSLGTPRRHYKRLCSRLLDQRVMLWGEGFSFWLYSKFDFGRLSSPFESLGDINNKDTCEVNTGDLIAETAVIQSIVLFSDILILFLAHQEIISPVFLAHSHCP